MDRPLTDHSCHPSKTLLAWKKKKKKSINQPAFTLLSDVILFGLVSVCISSWQMSPFLLCLFTETHFFICCSDLTLMPENMLRCSGNQLSRQQCHVYRSVLSFWLAWNSHIKRNLNPASPLNMFKWNENLATPLASCHGSGCRCGGNNSLRQPHELWRSSYRHICAL